MPSCSPYVVCVCLFLCFARNIWLQVKLTWMVFLVLDFKLMVSIPGIPSLYIFWVFLLYKISGISNFMYALWFVGFLVLSKSCLDNQSYHTVLSLCKPSKLQHFVAGLSRSLMRVYPTRICAVWHILSPFECSHFFQWIVLYLIYFL